MGFSSKLIHWYEENKRDLPWRKSTDPYTIWLSEIILQQTRVDQGLSYFNAFIQQYPDIEALAKAPEQEVLKLWQGLGYYSRARNLHFTAKYIIEEHAGVFPSDYNTILALKGIGEYTAAAITSFAYNMDYPVIDGNVYRVLSRIFGEETPIDSSEGKKRFKKLAEALIDKNRPAIYNQAIMEFGALQCTPKLPQCESCPFRLECFAFKNEVIALLPKKEKKIKQRHRYFNYLVVQHENHLFLNQRKEKDIWIGLYDFPLLETTQAVNSFEIIQNEFKDYKLSLTKRSEEFKHILSHQKIHAIFWAVSTQNPTKIAEKYSKIALQNLGDFPIPKLIDNYLKTT